MTYVVIGGLHNGETIGWRLAARLRKHGYRNPTLGERLAWGWNEQLIVWKGL